MRQQPLAASAECPSPVMHRWGRAAFPAQSHSTTVRCMQGRPLLALRRLSGGSTCGCVTVWRRGKRHTCQTVDAVQLTGEISRESRLTGATVLVERDS